MLIREQIFSSFGIEMVDVYSLTAPTIARKASGKSLPPRGECSLNRNDSVLSARTSASFWSMISKECTCPLNYTLKLQVLMMNSRTRAQTLLVSPRSSNLLVQKSFDAIRVDRSAYGLV